MSMIYTREIFKKFQVEVLGAAACHLNKEKEDEIAITYAVKDFEDNQDFMVEWSESKSEICCSCRLFEYNGYLCRHAIVVLQMSGVFSIPFKYILQRWTNAATSRRAICLDEIQSKVRRYNDLCRRAIILGEEGSLSQESYNVALGAIKEALKQCASVNNSAENDSRPSTLPTLAICGSELENQGCATTSKEQANLKMSNSNKASKRVESGKENDANKRRKVPLELEAVNVGTQGSFHEMVLSTSRPTQLLDRVPANFPNVVPTIFTNMTPTQFHNVASTHVHDSRLPR
ncbi:Protein FAR1-RELATED SEQUENCE like [Actinidia chinensis var. chinensis]|uniref:Protein FAR1-RELATED SEQUENCE n=1 Tax=Actinidia chinensis var. chinensis TaxID=1590841 RepID=A0A2R6PQS8_ACTCC|nr:Protein FAR1-RELATED SEQUENCE like [Actinidia chinensis var. chinensis]